MTSYVADSSSISLRTGHIKQTAQSNDHIYTKKVCVCICVCPLFGMHFSSGLAPSPPPLLLQLCRPLCLVCSGRGTACMLSKRARDTDSVPLARLHAAEREAMQTLSLSLCVCVSLSLSRVAVSNERKGTPSRHPHGPWALEPWRRLFINQLPLPQQGFRTTTKPAPIAALLLFQQPRVFCSSQY